MTLRAIFLLALLAAAGCAFTGHSSQSRNSSSLVSFLYPNGSTPPQENAIPELHVPLRVGLAFLPTQRASGDVSLDAAHKEELLERIRKKFSDRKFVSEIVIIPDYYLATSRGFMGGYPYSRHYIACSPIAGAGRNMQRDDWYTSQRNAGDLAAPEAVGRYAAQRALSRLGARGLDTRKCPVLFEAPLAAGLLGAFVQATSGGALYRKTSFLCDSLGKQVLAPHIQIVEDPHVKRATGSAPFDEEGVRTHRRNVVTDGVVDGYFLSTYSARKLGMQTTGNAGGSHNLYLRSKRTKAGDDFNAMLKKLGTGLLLTELMGQGVNYVTGDYSRGASGFWVENGEIQFPVEGITVAGRLQDMFQHIVAIGADTLMRGTKETGSILLEQMTIAGQ